MAEHQHYLSVGDAGINHPNKLLAVLSLGSPQYGDTTVVVLATEIVKNMKEARKWFKRMLDERPWETRQ